MLFLFEPLQTNNSISSLQFEGDNHSEFSFSDLSASIGSVPENSLDSSKRNSRRDLNKLIRLFPSEGVKHGIINVGKGIFSGISGLVLNPLQVKYILEIGCS